MKEREENRLRPCGQGYLTVYLALMLTLILSLLLTLIEGAKISATREQAELTAETCMESALSEFSRELLNRYDLLFIDLTYGTNSYSEDALIKHLSDCAAVNFSRGGLLIGDSKTFMSPELSSVTITGTRYAADNGAAALREQITAYMGADPVEGAAVNALSAIDQWQGLGIDTDAWERKRAEIEENAQQAMDTSRERFAERREAARERALSGEADTSALEEEEQEEEEAESDENTSLVRSLLNVRNDVLLGAILGDTSGLSDASVDEGTLLSHRNYHTGSGLEAANSHHYSEADQLVFDEYVLEKCGNYRNTAVGGEALDYEIEYILSGCASDRDNLSRMAEKLLLTREVLNTAYIFTDSVRSAEAGTIAAIACTLLLIPECTDAIKDLILLAWAMAESGSDVKTLLAGGRVPLVKDSSSWRTSLAGILTGITAASGGSGLSYEDYLRVFLFLENASQKNGRLMDVMEMNIRKTDGNSGFRMDWCMDSFSARFEVTSRIGYSTAVTKEITYN